VDYSFGTKTCCGYFVRPNPSRESPSVKFGAKCFFKQGAVIAGVVLVLFLIISKGAERRMSHFENSSLTRRAAWW